MTIENVMDVVKDRTGQSVVPSTLLSSLGLDSLEFVELLMDFPNIPDQKVPQLHTVMDLYLAQNGEI